MPRILISLLAATVLAGTATAQTPSTDRTTIDRAIAAVYPSLVRISVVAMQWTAGREIKTEAFGSGTIVSADGYVITNHHVVGRVQRIICTLPSNEEVAAELVGTDPLSDIAVLRLKPDKPRTFPAARFGKSAELRRGDVVLAMGSPMALSQSVTRGIVSNTDMTPPPTVASSLMLDGEDVGSVVKWIGHDAAIYPGNSGGPLVNLAGEIVGVNEISLGLSGAIPADLARAIFETIRRDGSVRRSWTGIDVQPRLSTNAGHGALISWVAPGSPADGAGVRTGDILVKVNDVEIDVRFAEQLPAANQTLFNLDIGRPARVVVRREGRDTTTTVTPTQRPPASSQPAEARAWGMVASDISAVEARDMGRAGTDGVRVLNLRPGGPADQSKPPLARNDVIVEIDGRPVRSISELEDRTRTALDAKSKTGLLVAFDRGRERRLTVLEVSLPAGVEAAAEASKAWIPVGVQVLTPTLAERLGLKGRTGVRVTRVLNGGEPLRTGDVILAIEGETIRASAPNDEEVFATSLRRHRIGATVTLTVHRDGADIPVPIVLAANPKLPREMATYEDFNFEFRARNLAASDQDDPRLSGQAVAGVLVESVSQGSWAAIARLAVGDIILSVEGHPVASVDELAARMKDVAARRPTSVVMHLRKGVRTAFIEIKPSWR
jgi:serine protease Do